MSNDLQLGKYEFYPFEFDKNTLSSKELLELFNKRKTKNKKLAAHSRQGRTSPDAHNKHSA